MRKIILSAVIFGLNTFTALADDVMTRTSDGTYIINTTKLAKDVEGYMSTTPVEVHIKKNKIVKVVVLKNQETPRYNAKVKKEMVPQYEGMRAKKGTLPEVDAVTGATFTSRAVQENVRRAVAYYKAHK